MPATTQSSDFWGWYLRHNNRTVWKHLYDAGVDLFASGPSNNPQAFLDLTNVLPAMNGGFNRRWGITNFATNNAASAPNIVRTFLYNDPNNSTNVWMGTDNQNFYSYTDAGVPFAGFGPANFTSSSEVSGVVSRSWFYYAGGLTSFVTQAVKKVNPSIANNTDSLCGIALPQALQISATAPGPFYQAPPPFLYSTLQLNPSVWTIAGSGNSLKIAQTNGVCYVSITTAGTGQTPGTYIANGSGGGGIGAQITYQIGSSGTLFLAYVSAYGSGYSSAPSFTIAAGGTPGTVTAVVGPLVSTSPYSGIGYKNTDTVSIVDPVGGGGGASATLIVDSAGRITGVTIGAGGSGYHAANATISSATGQGGSIILYVAQSERDVSDNLIGTGPVVGGDIAGSMNFTVGRQYCLALQNGTTGHTSDVYIQGALTGPKSGTKLDTLSAAVQDYTIASSTNATAGFTGMSVGLSVPTLAIDPQIDTVLLLAGADGQGLNTLYQVASIPLSNFTVFNGGVFTSFYQYWYTDTLPDTYNDQNTTGNTLLAANIWSEIDAAGDINGIALNTPPPYGVKYLTTHRGRLFCTDGKTLFYSKSLEEVTTSTGLITSKWEEAWPGDYQLPVALENELIRGLKSDGERLHIGTEKSIFTLYGAGPTDFSIPSTAFAQTGILSNDCWSVIYAEGQPSGFVWITPDFKVMHSDFSTYQDIGTAIYPVLQTLDPAKIQNAKIGALTQGPYNLVFLTIPRVGLTAPDFWIWESRLRKWYKWTIPASEVSGATVPSSFVYQFPAFTSSGMTPGSRYLFYWRVAPGAPNHISFRYFDPTQTQDLGANPIPWSVKTSWQDLGDPTSIKVINEAEFTSDDGPLTVSLWGATSQAQFDSGGALLKSGASVAGPISALGTQKFYTAGANTAAKYYSLQFAPVSPGTSSAVLTSFSLEDYPMARI